jgi:protein ImuB
MAFASIYVPNFLVQAVMRGERSLRDTAIALVDGTPPVWNVVAMNEAARQAGIELGMAKSQAAQFLGVEIRRRSRAQEAAAHGALLDLGWSVSPRVEETAADTLVLDLTGLAALLGSDEKIAGQIEQIAAGLGLEVRVAMAANLDVAVHAARGFAGITLIPAGEEARYLASLPVGVLSPPEEILDTLERWGVRTCGALADLPLLELSERLGQPGVRLHEWARGASVRSLVLAEPAVHFEEKMELEDAVAELEPLSFLLGRLLDQLCARLAARSLAASAIRLRFDLEVSDGNELPQPGERSREGMAHGQVRGQVRGQTRGPARKNGGRQIAHAETASKIFEKVLALPVPLQDSKTLLKLLRLQLQGDPPPSAIVKIALTADPARPRVAQGGLFLPSFPDAEKLELTIARLGHLVGDANIGAPQLVDTHRPGEFRMSRFLPPHNTSGNASSGGSGGAFVNRLSGSSPRRQKSAGASTHASGHSLSGHSLSGHSGPGHSGPGHSGPGHSSPAGQPSSGFRIFRPAPPASVEMRDGRPARVSFRGRRGDVVAASGPWRTSGDWWREDSWHQDEWDVEIRFAAVPDVAGPRACGLERIPVLGAPKNSKSTPRRGVYRIYYDALRGSWLVRGVYD